MGHLTVVSKHEYTINPQDNGGEAAQIITKIIDNGDGDLFLDQTVELQCYGIHYTIVKIPELTPEKLRELANQLESEILKAKAKIHKED